MAEHTPWPTEDAFINRLHEIGWRAPLDAQHAHIRKFYVELSTVNARIEVAETGFRAAVIRAAYQTVTNREINAVTEQRNRLLEAAKKFIESDKPFPDPSDLRAAVAEVGGK